MKNLLPLFIVQSFRDNRVKGSFNASTLFLDIAGFTSITEKLMNHGKEGAEILSDIINNVFNPLIDLVYAHGGFISGFAGDAFTAVFKDRRNQKRALDASVEILNKFKTFDKFSTKFGKFSLSIKQGLSYGKVNWGIVGNEKDKTYFFSGEAIDGCAQAEHFCQKNQIVIDKKILTHIKDSDIHLKPVGKGSFQLIDISFKLTFEEKIKPKKIPLKILSSFFPEIILKQKQSGEFREIISIFISFKEPKTFKNLNSFIGKILTQVDLYGGYFNHLDFGDKNANMLIFFGAPISYGNNISRAMKFIDTLREEFGSLIRIGTTIGTVYSGVVGSDIISTYTGFGDIINTSVRFMEKTKFGQSWISEKVKKRVENDYNVKSLGKKIFKGKSKAIAVYQLLHRKKKQKRLEFETKFIGRKSEFNKIRHSTEEIFNGTFGGVIYVYGDAGFGKSRLVYEVVKSLKIKRSLNIAQLQSDEIIKKSLSTFIYYFYQFFNQQEEANLDIRKKSFERNYSHLLKQAGTIKNKFIREKVLSELNRIKSIIGSIIGLSWKNSLIEKLNPTDLPKVTRFAIKEFFKILSLIKPLIIVVEDIHALDQDSQEVFNVLTRMINEFPMIFLVTSRINEKGNKPKLKTDTGIKEFEFNLNQLQKNDTREFIHHLLGKNIETSLDSFIFKKTEGNPFYVEQFCLYLQENNLLEIVKGTFSLKKQAINEIPTRINSILISRVDRLAEDLKETVQIASVFGREFEIILLLELIAILSQKKTGTLQTSIKMEDFERILERGKMEKIWDTLSELKYIFKHALLRDAVYEMQLKSRLRELHSLAGKAIENLFKKDSSKYPVIAYHFEKSEMNESSKKYYMLAGDQALNKFEGNNALKFFKKALFFSKKESSQNLKENILINKKIGEALRQTNKTKQEIKHWSALLKIKNLTLSDKYNISLQKSKAFEQAGEFDKGLKIIESFLENEKKYKDLKEYSVLDLKERKCDILHLKGDYDSVLSILKPELENLKKKKSKSLIDIAELNQKIGINYLRATRYKEAFPFLERALNIVVQESGEKNLRTASLYKNLGNYYHFSGDYKKAIKLFKKTMLILKNFYGEKSIEIASLLASMGVSYFNLGDLQKFYEFHKRAHEINVEILGPRHWLTQWSYNGLAGALFYIGNFNKAYKLYNTELEIIRDHHKDGHPDEAKVLNNLGMTCNNLGRYKEALKYFELSRKILKRFFGSKHYDLFSNYFNQANTYMSTGKHEQANKTLKKALKIHRDSLGNKTHYNSSLVINNIGRNYVYMKKYKLAIKYFKKAYEMMVELFGEQYPYLAFPLNGIGDAYDNLGQHEKALEYFEKSLETQLNSIGEQNQDTAYTYTFLGINLTHLKRFNDARKALLKSLEIRKKLWPKGHSLLSDTYYYYALTYFKEGSFKQANKYMKIALKEATKISYKVGEKVIRKELKKIQKKLKK